MNISTAMAYPVLQAAHDCGVKKVIAHAHASGVDAERRASRWLKIGLHYLCKSRIARYATDLLACSEKAARWMFPRKMVESGKVKTVFNSVDTSLFRPDPQLREYFRQELGLVGPDPGTKQGRKVLFSKQDYLEYRANGLPSSGHGAGGQGADGEEFSDGDFDEL
jgi:hypothetical protein